MKRTAVDAVRMDYVTVKQTPSALGIISRSPAIRYIDYNKSTTVSDEESPTHNVGYHLVDHEYGVTPQHQIMRDAPLTPPKISEVRYYEFYNEICK